MSRTVWIVISAAIGVALLMIVYSIASGQFDQASQFIGDLM